jgi:hypothetical protein
LVNGFRDTFILELRILSDGVDVLLDLVLHAVEHFREQGNDPGLEEYFGIGERVLKSKLLLRERPIQWKRWSETYPSDGDLRKETLLALGAQSAGRRHESLVGIEKVLPWFAQRRRRPGRIACTGRRHGVGRLNAGSVECEGYG